MPELKIDAPAGTPFVTMEREFNAPRELIHRAHIEPELVKQWLGPRKYEMTIERWDDREYRYSHRDPESGAVYSFHGAFHSLDIDNMVQTFEFEGAPGHVSLDALAFEDLGNGRTRIKARSVFQSVEDRDAMVSAGMADGLEDGYQRLEELLERLRVPAGR